MSGPWRAPPVLRSRPSTDLVNVPLRELKLRSGVLIAGIVRRDGEIVIPGGNDTIRAGDDVIVVTQDTALQELRDILRQG